MLLHASQASGVCSKLAVVMAEQTLQETGHDASVVKFIMPAPRIRNVSYPQAKQCASVEVPKAMFPAVKPNRMIEWSRHQIWLLVGQFRARSNHSDFSLSSQANAPTHHPVRQPPQ